MRDSKSHPFKFIACIAAISVIASGLAGCIVPEAGALLGHERKKRILYDVIRGVQCEIRRAVRVQLFGDGRTRVGDRFGENGKRKLQWFEKWNALITLTLRIDDSIEFNPGVSIKTPNMVNNYVGINDFWDPVRVVSQDYSFGFGGGIKYDTSREDIVTFAYPFSQFVNEEDEDLNKPCYTIGGITIEADLKIDDWLDDVLEPIKKCAFLGRAAREQETSLPFSTESITADPRCRDTEFPTDPITAITHEIDFILSFNASATPTWNLVRVSTTSGKLFGASRTDTSRLLISFGPPKDGVSGLARVGGPRAGKMAASGRLASTISPEMMYLHNAIVTGNAVSDSLRR